MVQFHSLAENSSMLFILLLSISEIALLLIRLKPVFHQMLEYVAQFIHLVHLSNILK